VLVITSSTAACSTSSFGWRCVWFAFACIAFVTNAKLLWRHYQLAQLVPIVIVSQKTTWFFAFYRISFQDFWFAQEISCNFKSYSMT
jgi:hypothetical protein